MNNLLNKQRILIVGSQRSGTTIAARILGQQLGKQSFYEENIGSHWRHAKLRYKDLPSNHVCQAPHLTAFCDQLNCDAVLFMKRPFAEIEASAERIGWLAFEQEEKEAFDEIGFKYGSNERIWEIKLRFYEQLINQNPDKYQILDYHSLSSHPYFIPKENRTHFNPRQTK